MSLAQPIVYTAQSKHFFYCRGAVCEFVFAQSAVPLHPFQMFGYFLDDRVTRDDVRAANNAVIDRVDALWTFGTEIADGVLNEIDRALARGLTVRHFTISAVAAEIREVSDKDLAFEQELLEVVGGDIARLRRVVSGDISLKTAMSTL